MEAQLSLESDISFVFSPDNLFSAPLSMKVVILTMVSTNDMIMTLTGLLCGISLMHVFRRMYGSNQITKPMTETYTGFNQRCILLLQAHPSVSIALCTTFFFYR